MITTIYLVRHAHSVYSSDELNRPLSDRGADDASRVTTLLQQEGIDVLISSPYRRAAQTIEGLSAASSIPIRVEGDFRERLLAGKPVEDFDRAIAAVWADFSFAWEGGESSLDAQRRGIAALEAVLRQHAGRKVAIGTHGNLMALIMNALDPRYDFAFWQQLDMPDIYRLRFDNSTFIEATRVWSR